MSESSIFDVFPPMPSDGKVTACEQNGQLISVSSSSKPYKKVRPRKMW